MAKDIITYEEYRKELEQQGFEITNPNGLKFALRANQGRRLKDNILEKYADRKKKKLRKRFLKNLRLSTISPI